MAALHKGLLKWQEAERGYKRAIELNPNYATARQWYGLYLRIVGRQDEAIKQLMQARALDPLSIAINSDLGLTYFYARQYVKAIAQHEKTLEIDPSFGLSHCWIGLAYGQVGRYEDAVGEIRSALSFSPNNTEVIGALGHALARAGHEQEARKLLTTLMELSEQRYVPPYDIAIVYVGLGENDDALAWLDRVISYDLEGLPLDPRLDPLRPDPRLQELIGRMQIPS